MTPLIYIALAKISTLSLAPAAQPKPCDPSSNTSFPFFFLPHWWEYIKTGYVNPADPNVCDPVVNISQNTTNIWAIGLWGLDILLRIAGFVAVIMIIVAGVTYMTAMGNPEKAASSRRRLYNSLIGLAIALIATALVSFIGNQLGG